MDMDWERQLGSLVSSLDHTPDAHPAERLAALVDEDISRLGAGGVLLGAAIAAGHSLIALHVVHAVGAALEPPSPTAQELNHL
jgi:hypothetical protein